MKFFKGLNDADASGTRYPKLGEGTYTVKCIDMVVEPTRQLGNCFFFEFEITKSTNAEHVVTAKRKWMQKLSDDTALPNLKAFLYAILGRDKTNPEDEAAIKKIDEKAEDLMEEACEKKTISGESIKGLEVEVDVALVRTKPKKDAPDGYLYGRHTWKPAA